MSIHNIDSTGGTNQLPQETAKTEQEQAPIKGAHSTIRQTPTASKSKIDNQIEQLEAKSSEILGKIGNIRRQSFSLDQELKQLEEEVAPKAPSLIGVTKGIELKIQKAKEQIVELKSLPKEEQASKGAELKKSLNGYIKLTGQLAEKAQGQEKNAIFKLKRELTAQTRQINKLLTTDPKAELETQARKKQFLGTVNQQSIQLIKDTKDSHKEVSKQKETLKGQQHDLQILLRKKTKTRQDLVKIKSLRQEVTKSKEALQVRTQEFQQNSQKLHHYNTKLINDISKYARDPKFDQNLLKSLKLIGYRNAFENINSFREAQVGGDSPALKQASNQFRFVSEYYSSSLPKEKRP